MAIDFDGKMIGAVLVDVAAAVGNLLQGWDNATIAGMFLLLRSYVFPILEVASFGLSNKSIAFFFGLSNKSLLCFKI